MDSSVPFAIRKAAKRGLARVKAGEHAWAGTIAMAARLANGVYSDGDRETMVEYFKDGRPTGVEWELHGGLTGMGWVKN